MDGIRGLLADLVSIDSVNPALVPGGAGEGEIARFVAAWLERAGLEVDVVEVAPGRPNVIGRARGSGGGRTLMLNAHTDVVGVTGMREPFAPRISGDRLYGRGAYDMKAGLAAALWVGARAASLDLRGDVLVAAVCDEEHASIGSEAVARDLRADAAIVTEPTALDVCIAHKGFAWLEVETTGRAAHGSQPELGIDAIAKMGAVLVGLEALDRELRASAGHPLLGTGSLHASLIEGGQELSSYPERCLVRVERRTIPGEDAALVESQIRGVCARAAKRDPDLHATVSTTFVRDAFEVAPSVGIVALVREHAAREAGHEPAYVAGSGWMDSSLLDKAGIPTVVFGPDGAGAHAVEEWADLRSLERCAAVLESVARDFCA